MFFTDSTPIILDLYETFIVLTFGGDFENSMVVINCFNGVNYNIC